MGTQLRGSCGNTSEPWGAQEVSCMTCPYSLESTQKQQHPAGPRTLRCCGAHSAAGVSLEWPLGHRDTPVSSEAPPAPLHGFSLCPEAEAFEQVPQKRANDSGTLIALRALSVLWGQRGEFSDAGSPALVFCPYSWRAASSLGCR